LLNVELGLFFDELRREDSLGFDSPFLSFQSLLIGLRDDGAALRQGLVVVVRRPDFRGGLGGEEGGNSPKLDLKQRRGSESRGGDRLCVRQLECYLVLKFLSPEAPTPYYSNIGDTSDDWPTRGGDSHV
jgi:hypothetical protein